MKKRLTGIVVGASLILGGGTIDVVDQQAPMGYAYQYPVESYVPTHDIQTATGTVTIVNEQPEYKDIDGDGIISVKVAFDKKGKKVFEQTDEISYKKFGDKNGELFQTAVDYKITLAEALLESITPQADASIATDSFTEGGIVNPGTSLTFNHTVTGSNPIIFATDWTNASSTITATYNGASMQRANDPPSFAGGQYLTIFFKTAPDTGTHPVVISRTSSGLITGLAASYTGASATGQPNVTNTNITNSSSGDFTTSVTTTLDNCWTILTARNNTTGVEIASTGSTKRGGGDGWYQLFDSGGPKTPAGVQSMSTSRTYNPTIVSHNMVTFCPAVAGPTNTTNNGCHGELHGTFYCQQ